jgi:hypothetical protein
MASEKKMKTGFNKLALAATLIAFAAPSYAAGTIIATAILVGASTATITAVAFAINMVIAAVITKAFFTPNQPSGAGGLSGDSPNPGNRQQLPPATDNKLPVVYGQAWLGGTIVDLSISQNNQELYYVIAISEVTNNGADTITFGDVYWGGKKCIFEANNATYNALGVVNSVSGNQIYTNNINSIPANGSQITFFNSGTPTVYTVASTAPDDELGCTITFTTTLVGVSVGNTIYGYVFNGDATAIVRGLQDDSTGNIDRAVDNKLKIYLYKNGSNAPANCASTAISVMQASGLIYKWDSTKLMTNTAFAVVHISYNSNAGLTGISQTRFQLTNSRFAPGDCFLDYLTNDVYGAAIPLSQVDTASLTALNVYCAGSFPYTNSNGELTSQARFRFDGVLNTDRSIMQNLQDMASSCDCLIKYNEILGLWGVITQTPTYTIAMALNDSNMVSSLQITPLDIAGSYNVIECKFPDNSNQDAFNSSTFDLAQIDPTLLYPNEPVNKQSVSLPLVNNDVRAQYIATRMLKASREDLQVQVTVNFQGIQLEAGDIVTVTTPNYGWVAKEFRVMKITEDFESNGAVTAKLILTEFTAQIYDDAPITEFVPSPNTGIPDPLVFGTVPAPTIGSSFPTNANPLFLVNITASSAGIIQYAELWYSAFRNPLANQLIFAGTTEIQSNGTPYNPGSSLPPVSLASVPAGTWFFFSRMVNSLGTSSFSPASSAFVWKPTTFQYSQRYLAVAYADNANGTSNFSLTPTNRLYYGLQNTDDSSGSTNASDYTWYLADPSFSTNRFLCYANQTGRRFSFATGFAGFAAGTGAFVPTQAIIFDPRLWAALPNGTNIIDLDMATGQVLTTGTTTVGTGEIEVTNNPDGKVVASLKQYLDFGSGIYSKTTSAALLTVDIYGRVVGFEEPDNFYITIQSFTATSGQTVFTVTRAAGYISGQCFVFINGILQDASSYTDTAGSTGTVTFTSGASLGTIVTIISFKSVSNLNLNTTATSGNGTTATLSFATRSLPPFTVGQVIKVVGVTPAGYNGTYTVTNCTTSTVSYANTTTGSQTVSGTIAFNDPVYPSFSRNTATLTNASSYTPSGYAITSGYEFMFLNGVVMTEQDYDIVGGVVTNFPSVASGLLTVIQWTANNLTTPNGDPVNVLINTIIGQASYPFSYITGAFNLYQNGVLLLLGNDYTTVSGGYNLTNTPTVSSDLLLQQTFARTGAV